MFDLDGDGKISCAEFLSLFFRIKRTEERNRRLLADAKKEEERAHAIMEEKKQRKKYEEEVAQCVEPWVEDDLKSAVEMIAEVAAAWDISKAGFGGLKGLQCAG